MNAIARRIQVLSADITELDDIDIVVTAANEGLLGGGGVDGAVHAAAGPQLLRACQQVAPCPTGQARVTPAFKLKAKWVVHAVGPVYRDGRSGEPAALADAYRSALVLADQHRSRALAFPCISTGTYGYPPEPASRVAFETVWAYLSESQYPEKVVFCCFQESDTVLYHGLLGDRLASPNRGPIQGENPERNAGPGGIV